MRPDDLEFLIAQYADGSLSSEQAASVEAMLRRDPRARQALEEYRSVDAALTELVGAHPAPEVRWDRLADRISRQVATLGTTSVPFTEEVEQQIAAYADSSLPGAETRLIEARLEADPQARLLLSEYASLERIFEAVRATPLPAVRWDALSRHLSHAVADETAASTPESYKMFAGLRGAEKKESSILGRIGQWLAAPRRLAIAACLLIGASVSIRMISSGVGPQSTPSQETGTPGVVQPGTPEVATKNPPKINVKGPGDLLPPGLTIDHSAMANVEIGPPANGADPLPGAFAEDGTPRPSRSSVATDKAGIQEKDAKAQRDSGWFFPR